MSVQWFVFNVQYDVTERNKDFVFEGLYPFLEFHRRIDLLRHLFLVPILVEVES